MDKGKNLNTVGKGIIRVDAVSKANGECKFATDLYFEDMAYAAMKTAGVAHAIIKKIHIEKAKAIPGVLEILTAEDIPGKNQVGAIIPDQPLIAEKKVRYFGDVVAIVAAETKEIARQAVAAIEVDYDILEPIFTVEEALKSDNHIHEKGNISCQMKVRKGNIEEGFRKAEVIIEEDISTPFQEHCYFEPMAAIATRKQDNNITIYGSMQCPFYIQKAVSDVIGIPLNRVRVIQTPTGGGFGGKEDVPSEIYSRLALLAYKVNRPVKMVLQREEDIEITSKRHPTKMKYKLGATKDGKLVAAKVDIIGESGAYVSLTPVVMFRATAHAAGPYRIPTVHVDTKGVYTNLNPTGAFRGFGGPQVAVGMELALDILAEKLDMDPAELRMKNILVSGDETMTEHLLEKCEDLKPSVEKALEVFGWEEKYKKLKECRNSSNGRYLHGIGMSVTHYGNSLGAKGWSFDKAGSFLQIHRDGSVSVAIGNIDMGQGAMTVLSQITAEALGVSIDHVNMMEVDTSRVPDSGPTVASRSTIMSGNAIVDAAEKLKERLSNLAAEKLETSSSDITFENNKVFSKTNSEKSINFNELAEMCFLGNIDLSAEGWFASPKLKFDENGLGNAYFAYSYATNLAEVKIDTITGEVKVEKVVASHASGKAINPVTMEGQIEGGVVQGIGYATYENFQFDKKGKVLTDNFSTYIIPTSMDIPEIIPLIVEEINEIGPFGAKSIGEPGIIPTAAAVINAISNAIGIRMNHAPVTPEKIKMALLNKK